MPSTTTYTVGHPFHVTQPLYHSSMSRLALEHLGRISVRDVPEEAARCRRGHFASGSQIGTARAAVDRDHSANMGTSVTEASHGRTAGRIHGMPGGMAYRLRGTEPRRSARADRL